MSIDSLPSISDHDLERVTGGFLEEGDSGGWGEGDIDSMTTMDNGPYEDQTSTSM